MKKLNLYSGLALVLALLVAGILLALGKFPVVTEMEHDELNQLSLLWVATSAGLNFFIYTASFSPMLDRINNVTRVLALTSGVTAVVSYFLEYQYAFEPRFFLQSSLLLALITIAFYFLVRHVDNDVQGQ